MYKPLAYNDILSVISILVLVELGANGCLGATPGDLHRT